MPKIVAIVGRPNVGKSTLYNRLIGERQAIIDNVSGVTRDRIYGPCEWNGRQFTVIDTGGFVKGSEDVFEAAIRSQVQIAIEEADIIVFMTDVTTGITDLDADIADILRKTDKTVFLSVNKVDNATRQLSANEFWGLGFENTFFLSAITGSGSGELLDAITDSLPSDNDELDDDIPKISIIGQPNVGKSSLTNALLGKERNIVTDIAGTTRDAIHERFNKFGKDFYIIDTAGIRKKAKVHEDLEFYSVMRAVKAIEESDVCILMIDATKGLTAQDLSLLRLVEKRKKGLVLAVNKWDLLDKETNTARDMENTLREKIGMFTDIPIIFISALEKQRILKVMEIALEVEENRRRRIKTSKLNEIMLEAIERVPPPAQRGRFITIKYVVQLPTHYPAFAFFCNSPKYVRDAYKAYLENQLRKNFNFTGVPVTIFFREK
jgi:GTP-binding protein